VTNIFSEDIRSPGIGLNPAPTACKGRMAPSTPIVYSMTHVNDNK
jgi:hypothetical protein